MFFLKKLLRENNLNETLHTLQGRESHCVDICNRCVRVTNTKSTVPYVPPPGCLYHHRADQIQKRAAHRRRDAFIRDRWPPEAAGWISSDNECPLYYHQKKPLRTAVNAKPEVSHPRFLFRRYIQEHSHAKRRSMFSQCQSSMP